MKKYLLKLFILLIALVGTFFFVTINVNALPSSGMAYFISTQFGEDASTMASYHYHSEQDNTYVMLTTEDDTEFAKAKKIEVTSTLIDYYTPAFKIDSQGAEGFPEVSYECVGRSTDLTPNTYYMWYVTDGVTKSNVYKFHTAEGDNTAFTFAYTTDSQNYTDETSSRYKAYEGWGKSIFATGIKNNTPIDFVISGGDIVENSGRALHWSYFFGPDYLQNTVFMPTPGNHDFSGLISSGSVDGRFVSSMFDLPLNGAEGQYPELCYFFKYNDTLFISLCSSSISRSAQVTWLDEVLKNNPAQYKVVTIHYPMNSTATDNAREFVPILDKYNVDLSLYGHTHTYDIDKNFYNYSASKDPNVGTTYISAASPEGAYGNPAATQVLFTFTDSVITVRTYTNENVQIDAFPLTARRIPTSQKADFNEEEFLKTVKINVEQEVRKTAKVTYDASAYNNVYRLSLKNGSEIIATKYATDSINNYFNVSGLTPDTEYNMTLELEYYDGTVKEVAFPFHTRIASYGTLKGLEEGDTAYGYRYKYTPSFRPEVESLAVYVNDVKVGTASITDRKILVSYDNLPSNKQSIISIRAVLKDGSESEITSTVYGEEVKTNKAIDIHSMEDGADVIIEATVLYVYGTKGAMLNDETGSIYVYGDMSSTKIGDKVSVTGKKGTYNGAQITFPEVTVISEGTVIPEYDTISADDYFALENTPANYGKFVCVEGTLVKNDKYINLEVANGKQISLFIPSEDLATFEKFVGKHVDAVLLTYNYYEGGSVFNAFFAYYNCYITVRFLDHDGTVLKQEFIKNETVTAPANPTREGYTFTNWDKDFSNITEDIDITACYEINKYNVVFKNEDGTIIETVVCEYGKAATAPTALVKEGYTFKGWDKDFSSVTGDLEVKATYELDATKYNVVFKDHDGKVLKTEEVEEGSAATAPTNPTRDGYTFKGWDKEFTNVTSDLEVKPIYEVIVKKYTVVFKDHDDKVLKTEEVEEGSAATAPANPTREGYVFKGWDKEFANVTAALEVKATYAKLYTVTFKDKDGKVLATVSVEEGKAATAPQVPEIKGFTFDAWDVDYNNVTSDIVVTAVFTENSGCGNSASIIFTSFMLLGFVLLRKKNW